MDHQDHKTIEESMLNAAVDAPTVMWTNPADHFRPRAKMLTLYTDRGYMVMRWLAIKESILNKWFLPWWTPLYSVSTHVSQRSRNMFLCENHLNYRPYKFRPNTETSQY